MKAFWLASITFVIAACSAHSPLILKNTTDYPPARARGTRSSRTGPVFVTPDALEAGSYEEVRRIDIGHAWYGSSRGILDELADRARERGADVIMEAETWHQPSGWAWAAPHGRGIAVVLKTPSTFDAKRYRGEYH